MGDHLFSFITSRLTSEKYKEDLSKLWKSQKWKEHLKTHYKIKRIFKKVRCLGRTHQGLQCKQCVKGNNKFCGIHNRLLQNKTVCKKCTKYFGKSIVHKYKWEHNGRFDLPKPEQLLKINNKQCMARIWNGKQCSRRAYRNVHDLWFCGTHCKQYSIPKKCYNCTKHSKTTVYHTCTWECFGHINQAEPPHLTNRLTSNIRPIKFYKNVKKRIEKVVEDELMDKNTDLCLSDSEFDSGTDIDLIF